jgi:hypothetical protein
LSSSNSQRSFEDQHFHLHDPSQEIQISLHLADDQATHPLVAESSDKIPVHHLLSAAIFPFSFLLVFPFYFGWYDPQVNIDLYHKKDPLAESLLSGVEPKGG